MKKQKKEELDKGKETAVMFKQHVKMKKNTTISLVIVIKE